MLALYPSNKLEHLSTLLATLLDQQPSPPFTADTILVESPGMQHWLSMELARQHGVSMNLAFPLPTRFMWNTARTVLGENVVPTQSPYRREVLMWRIDTLLVDHEVKAHPSAARMTAYWEQAESETERSVKRLQLAMNLADVFEQYLLYRPEWLQSWEQGDVAVTGDEDEAWQALIWQCLVKENPLHPAKLHQMALAALAEKGEDVAQHLPQRLIVFAINTMAPQLVSFFDALAQFIDIHLFHLNPSVNYWGNAQSDKAQAKMLREQGLQAWMAEDQSNPLLANLGRQGRDLFNLLTQLDTFEISAFDDVDEPEVVSAQHLLGDVQTDVLLAQQPDGTRSWREGDDSIHISSGHSALREVQALHDYLLHQFNADDSLTPQDVVVMCPKIEEYAPFVDAVFHRVGTPKPEQSDIPRIPCSIADRAPLDAEPLIATFIELLSLPDSRFEVNHIVDYLRLPAVQRKFSIEEDSLELMVYFLKKANIHWGLDAQHRARVSDGVATSAVNTWRWGLNRLMVGMACEDLSIMTEDLLTLPDVEGQQSLVLGQLMALVDTLQFHAESLSRTRTIGDWEKYLRSLRDDCFEPDEASQDAWESIGKAIGELAEHCDQAAYKQRLHLRQIREVLAHRFSSPDAGNHFMTGQVTFCSMLPMRSIPFKVVAILGLNDGAFPRLNQPNSINIMQRSAARLGDRSRRLEDRYLFLEGIISARENLYLSYQGNSVVDNSERQPSLVLQELMALLKEGYHWQADKGVHHLPLHPFSQQNFTSEKPSFEAGWQRLAQALYASVNAAQSTSLTLSNVVLPESLSVQYIASAFDNPLAFFAQQQLKMYLDLPVTELQDTEPFSESSLTRYKILETMVDAGLHKQSMQSSTQRFRLDGVLPDNALTDDVMTVYEQAVEKLISKMEHYGDAWTEEPTHLRWSMGNTVVSAYVHESEHSVVSYHTGTQHDKRIVEQWLTALLCWVNGIEKNYIVFYGKKWGSDKAELRKVTYTPVDKELAEQYLQLYLSKLTQILTTPSLYYARYGADVAKKLHDFAKKQPDSHWQQDDAFVDSLRTWWRGCYEYNPNNRNLAGDAYFQWFYPVTPELEALPLDDLYDLYAFKHTYYKDSKEK